MSSARSVGVIYDDKPLVQLRKEDKLANHSSQRNNASEEQPLRQCWGPRNIVALSDKGLTEIIHWNMQAEQMLYAMGVNSVVVAKMSKTLTIRTFYIHDRIH